MKKTRSKQRATRSAARPAPAKDVAAYLARLPADARAALERLRRVIRAAAPEATEAINYQMPTFRLHGGLVAYAAFQDHLSFFVMSPAVMEAHKRDLKGYPTSKGTVRFSQDAPLPVALVKKLVKARIAENRERAGAKRAGSGPRARRPGAR